MIHTHTAPVFLARALIWALALLFLPAAPMLAAETPDLFGPQITVLSPADGSVLAADRPVIAASVSDAGSGVNPETIRLVVDGMDVTQGCRLQSDTSETWTVTYVPASALGGGVHRVSLQAADRTGNTSRQEWSFSVALEPVGPQWGFSGASTLTYHALPLPRLSEHLGLQFEAGISEHATLNAAVGLEWLSPLLISGEPFGYGTFRVANYAVVLETGPLRTAVGAIEVELPSHVLFPLIGTNVVDGRMSLGPAASSPQISGFAGRTLASSGFSLSLLSFAGGSLEFFSKDEAHAYAMAVRTEADDSPGVLALFGMDMPLAGAQTYLEGLLTLSPDNTVGYGVATGFAYRGQHSGLTAAFLGRDLVFETPLLAARLVDRTRAELLSSGYLVLGRAVLTGNLAGAYGQRPDTGMGTFVVNTDAALRVPASGSLSLSARYQGAVRYVEENAGLWRESGTHSATGGILFAPPGSAGGKAHLDMEALFNLGGEWAGLKAAGAVNQPMGPGTICLSREWTTRRDAKTSTSSYRGSVILQSADQPVILFGVQLSGSLGGEVQITQTNGPATESSTVALSISSKLDLGFTETLTLAVDGRYSIGTKGPDYRLKLSLRRAF